VKSKRPRVAIENMRRQNRLAKQNNLNSAWIR
jgi:hypothetical protein